MARKFLASHIAVLALLIAGTVHGSILLHSSAPTSLPRTADLSPVRICALRVEFRPDSITGTSGDGLMGVDTVSFPDSLIIDGLPHDRLYFADHLAYLRHYYETVSGGRLAFDTVASEVYPLQDERVYRLDYPMWHYNHNAGDEQLNAGLTQLFVDAVHKADSTDHIDFTQYNAIIIFHAGVGKDFNLGYDTTPFDIPSAYINETDLLTYPDRSRIPAGVTRGLILPEGENQAEALVLGIELSMNGIMIKLFGNWLGLPDLFNTNTGQSGVGRWGMMDQGSGNADALVPAYPDAWSRVRMGWESPVIAVPTATGDTVRVARVDTIGAPHIVKIPVTPREYYLIENRDADADSIGYVELQDRDGRRMRIDHEGGISRPDGSFRIAVRASHYDFGIPGSGLLIWHIDEDVINRKIDSNRVNTDPDHRGIDLVEADGSQDLGRDFGFAAPGSGTELGIAEDAWFKNNRAYLDANTTTREVRFHDRSFPSTRLYDGTYTKVELNGFSEVASIMSFVAKQTDAAIGFPVSFPSPATWTVADVRGSGRLEAFFAATSPQLSGSDTLFKVDSLGRLILLSAIPRDTKLVSLDPPVDIDSDGKDEVLFKGSRIGLLQSSGDTVQAVFTSQPGDLEFAYDVFPASFDIAVPGIVCVGRYVNDVGASENHIALYDLALNKTAAVNLGESAGTTPQAYNLESSPSNRFLVITGHEARCFSVNDSALTAVWTVTDPRIAGTAVVLAEPDRRTVFLDGYGYVDAETGSTVCLVPNCIRPTEDWNGDGFADNGGPDGRSDIRREDFPDVLPDTSWIVDIDANREADLFGYSLPQSIASLGVNPFTRVQAIGHRKQPFADFPRAASVTDPVRPFTWTRNPALHFMATTVENGRYYYALRWMATATSAHRFAYSEDRAIINLGPQRLQANARDKWAYCWPNPTSDVSRIRISLPYRAAVTVHIFDLAGRRVTELSGVAPGAGSSVFEIPWNVNAVESGVYIGQVTAQGNGTSQKTQIKIAVVK